MPTTRCSASTTADAPSPLALISRMSPVKDVSGRTCGTAVPVRMTSSTWVSNLRPKAPPGCERAKSSGLKPRASSNATASASPMASWAVVLAVGAKFRGQASCATALSSVTRACLARIDCRPPVMAISGTPWRVSTGKMAASSSLSPLLEMASTTSIGWIMPRSPWLASAGCTNMAGVPVDASVAAILRPMWPLLPIPMTTTRPRHTNIICTACANSGPMRATRPSTAAASISKVFRPRASAWLASKFTVSKLMTPFYRGIPVPTDLVRTQKVAACIDFHQLPCQRGCA